MKVLWVIDKLTVDGRSPSCIALNLRDARPLFENRGCMITVCNLRGDDPGADLLRAAGTAVVETGAASASPKTFFALLRAARQAGAELIHAHGYASANYGRMAARYLRLPVVIHEHAILRVRPHQYLFDRLARRWTTRGVAISRAVADFMVHGRCVPPDRIEVIPNGIDLSRFQDAGRESRESARERFGWPADAFIIGSAARFRREKGLETLFDAALRLQSLFPELLCVMAGDGEGRAELQRRAATEGLDNRILFPGFVEDMPRFMRALSLLVIPSLQEGLCYSAMEAMAAGTPVIASRTGGLTELIDDGAAGILVPPGDAKALSGGIERLLRDGALRQALARKAARAAMSYDLDKYVDRITGLYRRLISNPLVTNSTR